MSIRAKLLKQLLRWQFSGWSDGTIAEQRARQERSARINRPPAHTSVRPISAGSVDGAWIASNSLTRGVVLYLHGGAYALGSIHVHREWIARLAAATRSRALAINYRLAPEHPFPAALEDTISSFRWLLEQGVAPEQILMAGDSAGGGLAIAASLALRDRGHPLPAGVICISPWFDLTLSGASIQSRAKLDPILDPDSLKRYAAYYANDQDPASPLLSPVFADLSGLPPILLQVGSDEILLDDATRLAERARASGVTVTLEIWDQMVHVFHMFSFLPETRQAVEHIADFASDHLPRITT